VMSNWQAVTRMFPGLNGYVIQKGVYTFNLYRREGPVNFIQV